MEFSNLRLLGFLAGVSLAVMAFVYFRRNQISTGAFLTTAVAGFCMMAVGVNPNIVNMFLGMLNLEAREYSRIIALLIITNIVAIFSILQLYKKIAYYNYVASNTILAIATAWFYERRRSFACKDVAVVIPAFNEADNIEPVLKEIPVAVNGLNVVTLVIDDCSSDSTGSVAEGKGAFVAKMPIQLGGGIATQAGFSILRETDVQYVVTMDADGQHLPSEMPVLLKPLMNGEADVVIGSRLLGSYEDYSSIRILGVRFFGQFISFITGKKVTDPASGYRALTADAMNKLDLRQRQYHTSELIIEAIKKGFRIVEVPITIRRRHSGTSKKGGVVVYAMGFAKVVLQTWLRTPK
ncbi:MAG: glycosyltransferase family 2 protein [Nitrospinae bacterium]|nr:glycosyltransferase family 2 protein [Nitrospinota bacterium]